MSGAATATTDVVGMIVPVPSIRGERKREGESSGDELSEIGVGDGRMPRARREASDAGRWDARELMIYRGTSAARS